MLNPAIDGIIPCSIEEGNNWSFCAADANGKISKVTEKDRISDYCSVGFYYFRSSRDFIQYTEKELARLTEHSNTETYVAPLYNLMIKDGKIFN